MIVCKVYIWIKAIYSRIDPEIIPVGNDSLDVHFVIAENHKVYIRNISIKGMIEPERMLLEEL